MAAGYGMAVVGKARQGKGKRGDKGNERKEGYEGRRERRIEGHTTAHRPGLLSEVLAVHVLTTRPKL